jgi:L-ascorbate metabolism protein UlaG (beta-lactamase superfamily)
MKITQLRNATIIVELGPYRILVDPMLAEQGALPSLKWLGGPRRRNPIVGLPAEAPTQLEQVTHCLITHCQKGHFDHLDRAGVRWLRQRQIPVFCMPGDADYLLKRGLNVHSLPDQPVSPFLSGTIRPVACVHGEGLIGRLMAHGFGYLIAMPGEPSVYLAGDTLLTDEVSHCLGVLKPDVSVVPAGGAAFDVGQTIIMGRDDAITAARLSGGVIIANHLEELDHCPVSRAELLAEAGRQQLGARLKVPEDGETLEFHPVERAA